ncbi:hypothetical protein BDD12DRAFT_830067 [Trichophaea hybrida]|nr:hypothetical protein BDD12DRAFT_830067 [Trichophaea hybrida]
MASGMLSLWAPSQPVIAIIDQPMMNFNFTLLIEFGEVNTATIIPIITVETPKGYHVHPPYTPTFNSPLYQPN